MNRIFESPFISRLRRNHGLEHATIHILSRRKHNRPLAGHSDSRGFRLVGDVSTEELADGVTEALARLRGGERYLAVHPNCGTNLATYGMAAGLGAFIGMVGVGRRWRDKFERLPLVVLLATLALVAAQPVAFRLQERFTTSGDPGDMIIVEIFKTRLGGLTVHRVLTKG